jgi:hypothetical protein
MYFADVAQLVERRLPKPPITHLLADFDGDGSSRYRGSTASI